MSKINFNIKNFNKSKIIKDINKVILSKMYNK